MINIRLIIYSLIEPEFKEVGWLHKINNILVLSFYNNGVWENTSIESTPTGGIQVVNTKSDLDSLTSKGYGNLVYVKDEDQYYSYSNTESWERILKLYIDSVEPVNKTVLCVKIVNQYVKFSNVFPTGVYNNATSYGSNQNFAYTFAYYTSGYVTHEAIKTLVDNTTTNNYKYYG